MARAWAEGPDLAPAHFFSAVCTAAKLSNGVTRLPSRAPHSKAGGAARKTSMFLMPVV